MADKPAINKPVLAIAGILALLSAALLWSFTRQIERRYLPGVPRSILVATQPVIPGAILSREMLRLREVPANYVHPSSVQADDVYSVEGQPLLVGLAEGQPLLWSDLRAGRVSTRQSLGAFLRENERAITIGVDAASSAGGNLRPGDRVDVFATMVKPGSGDEVTLPLLQNVTVLATGDRFGEESKETNERDLRRRRFDTVSLIVLPQEAQYLSYAQTHGRLSLVVRSPDDLATQTELVPVTWRDIFQEEKRKAIQKRRDDITVIRAGGERQR